MVFLGRELIAFPIWREVVLAYFSVEFRGPGIPVVIKRADLRSKIQVSDRLISLSVLDLDDLIADEFLIKQPGGGGLVFLPGYAMLGRIEVLSN